MLNSAKSPWKPLICNFQSSYDNFMQMQSLEELERCSAEVGEVNPGFNATRKVEIEMHQCSYQIHGIVAAVVALFPKIFPTGLPSKYFMHARLAFWPSTIVGFVGVTISPQPVALQASDLAEHKWQRRWSIGETLRLQTWTSFVPSAGKIGR